MVVSDFSGIIRLANPLANRLFGYEEEGLVGKRIADLVPEEKKEAHENLRHAYFEDPSERLMGKGRELQGVRKDGTVFPIEISLNYLYGDDGEMLVVSSVIDITERLRDQKLNELSIMQVQEEERKRLAQELHDGVAQVLSAISLNLKALSENYDPELQKHLEELAHQAIHETRGLSHQLKPPDLVERDLVPAIEEVLNRIERDGGPRPRLIAPSELGEHSSKFELALYRICQEGVNNAAQHSDADSIVVRLEKQEDKGVFFSIEDDGVGMEVQKDDEEKGMGLHNIRQRVKAFNGRLNVSSEKGNGTVLEGFLPFDMELERIEEDRVPGS